MVATVEHLLKSRAPENINFSGDSAGGMLILAFLLHKLHPHPSVPHYTLPAGSRFGEALLISPGAPVITETASFRQDPNLDIITPEIGRKLWGAIISTSETGIKMPNPWIASSSAPEEWWKGLPVGEAKIIVGGYEVLRDDIAIWSGYLKVCNSTTIFELW
jgi:acetyl esterase/lipase